MNVGIGEGGERVERRTCAFYGIVLMVPRGSSYRVATVTVAPAGGLAGGCRAHWHLFCLSTIHESVLISSNISDDVITRGKWWRYCDDSSTV